VLDPALERLGSLDERVRAAAAGARDKAAEPVTADELDAILVELVESGRLSLEATPEPTPEPEAVDETEVEVEASERVEPGATEVFDVEAEVEVEPAVEAVVEPLVAPAPIEGRHSSSVNVVRISPAPEAIVEPEEVVDVETEPEPEVVAVAEPEPEVEVEVEVEAVVEPEPEVEVEAVVEQPDEMDLVVASLFARIRADNEVLAPAPAGVVGVGADSARPRAEADEDLTDARARALAGPERGAARALKRELADEQNELLDVIRRSKTVPSLAEALPETDVHATRYAMAARSELRDAAYAGAHFIEPAPDDIERPIVDDLAAALGVDIIAPLRERLAACWDESRGNEVELSELVRGTYRQWRNRVLPEVSRRFVAEAFNRGIRAIHDERAERWLVDIS
jgi:hypothetical protein